MPGIEGERRGDARRAVQHEQQLSRIERGRIATIREGYRQTQDAAGRDLLAHRDFTELEAVAEAALDLGHAAFLLPALIHFFTELGVQVAVVEALELVFGVSAAAAFG